MKRRVTLKKVIKWLLGIVAGLVIISAAVVYFYLPRLVTEIKNPIIYKYRPVNVTFAEAFPTGEAATITSFDGVHLSGFLTKTDTLPAKGTIILLHGIRNHKESYEELCGQLNEQGYNAFALDLRAHGQSEGVHNTFGAFERKDVSAVVDYLEKKGYKNIGIWGRSLGGAIAIQSLATDQRLKFGVIESTFSDFNIVVHDYTKIFTGIDSYTFSDFLVKRAGQIVGFDPTTVKPAICCKQIHQPVYMSHGTADDRIPFKYGLENFNALASTQKVFETIPNATHKDVWYIAGEAHFNKIMNFLDEIISKPESVDNNR